MVFAKILKLDKDDAIELIFTNKPIYQDAEHNRGEIIELGGVLTAKVLF